MNQTFLFYRMNESWDTGDKLLINIAQAVCQCTNADRPVLVTADGPTCINVPEDLVNYPPRTNHWSTLPKHHSRLAVVAVLRLSLSMTCLAVVAVLRLSLFLSMTWQILTGIRTRYSNQCLKTIENQWLVSPRIKSEKEWLSAEN